eukprot:TRINITY_DN12663_c0_g1_i1.p1 TRINITY_DN12663_c0_g1~~TRINITY_DN12663_c0_g1_i1.p1  ORF type:complete len:214 (-),score=28.16 TRINITY_DN12663_c0_g1_i1:470-1111(-)
MAPSAQKATVGHGVWRLWIPLGFLLLTSARLTTALRMYTTHDHWGRAAHTAASQARAFQSERWPNSETIRGPPSEQLGGYQLRVERLHLSARKAIKHKHADWASRMYTYVLTAWTSELDSHDTARTYLLMALNEQRLGQYDAARFVFMRGMAHCHSPKLLLSWALFESKHGRMDAALALAQRSVELDRSLAPVLRWKMFADASAVKARGRSQT